MSVVINGSAGLTTNSGAVYNGIQSATAQASTSGTNIDFTSIPSWVKRITVMFQTIGTSGGGAKPLIQLGTSGGMVTTGYAEGNNGGTSTAGIILIQSASAADRLSGIATLTLLSGTTWVANAVICNTLGASTFISSGSISLASALTQIRITTANGTDTFVAGSINILYE